MIHGSCEYMNSGVIDPNPFQAAAIQKLGEVLANHHVEHGGFALNTGTLKTFWTLFTFKGEEHVLAVFEDNVNMRQGPSLYECYMPEEFVGEDVRVENFVVRLDRYLSGLSWAGEGEEGPLDRVWGWVANALRIGKEKN